MSTTVAAFVHCCNDRDLCNTAVRHNYQQITWLLALSICLTFLMNQDNIDAVLTPLWFVGVKGPKRTQRSTTFFSSHLGGKSVTFLRNGLAIQNEKLDFDSTTAVRSGMTGRTQENDLFENFAELNVTVDKEHYDSPLSFYVPHGWSFFPHKPLECTQISIQEVQDQCYGFSTKIMILRQYPDGKNLAFAFVYVPRFYLRYSDDHLITVALQMWTFVL